jgi:Predicted membrane protein
VRARTRAEAAKRTATRENTMHGWFWFVLIGLISGWLAGRLMNGSGFGILGDIVLGILGAVVGGWIFGQLGFRAGGFLGSVVVATVGAVVLIFGIRLLKKV